MDNKKVGVAKKKRLVTAMLVSAFLILASVCLIVYVSMQQGQSRSENIADLGEEDLVSAIFLDDQSIVVGFSSNKLQMIDHDGNVRWTHETGGSVKSVAVSNQNGSVYAACEDGSVLMLDREGNLITQISVKGRAMDLYYSPEAGKIVVSHGVGVTSQKFYVTQLDDQLADPLRYQTWMDTYACAVSEDGTNSFYGTKDCRVGMANDEGVVVWEVYSKYPVKDMFALDSQGLLLVVDEKGYVYAISYGGEALWSVQIEDTTTVSVSADTQNRTILTGDTAGYLHSLSYDGEYLGKRLIGTGAINAVTMDESNSMVLGTCGSAVFSTGAFENAKSVTFDFSIIGIIVLLVSIVSLIICFLMYMYIRNQQARETMREIKKSRMAYFMLIPTFSLLFVFVYFPIVNGFWGAFTNWSPFRETQFVGLDNFRKIIGDEYVWTGVKNMLLITGTGLLKSMIMPLLAALLIVHLASNRLKYAYRTGFVLTTIVPGVAAALMWKMMLDPNIGLINNILSGVGLEHLQHAWLAEESIAIWAIIFIGFPWIGIFQFLVFYGGFIGISGEIYDSASIDGANIFVRFFKIELPMITPQLKMILLLSLIWGMQDYQNIYLITKGGPGMSTYVPALEVFYNVSNFGEYGYASAIGLMLFAFILIVSLIIQRIPTTQDN